VEFVSTALIVLAVTAALLWLGIVALATPTVVYRFDRRFDPRSREFEHALSSALATTMVGGNRMTRLENGAQFYPEMLHHSNWASLGAGAAMTPSEWNDGASYGRFDDEMAADMARLATFVEEVPLVTYDPARVGVTSSDPELRGWAVAGDTGGVLWVQDFALEGSTMDEIRADHTVRTGASVALDRLAGGTWTVTPFDTWAGVWMEPINIDCPGDQPCQLTLPDFSRDIAFKLIKN